MLGNITYIKKLLLILWRSGQALRNGEGAAPSPGSRFSLRGKSLVLGSGFSFRTVGHLT